MLDVTIWITPLEILPQREGFLQQTMVFFSAQSHTMQELADFLWKKSQVCKYKKYEITYNSIYFLYVAVECRIHIECHPYIFRVLFYFVKIVKGHKKWH